jgi:hypothetical protein
MGSAHGATHVQHCVNSAITSSSIHYNGYRTKHSPLDAEGMAHRQRMKRELALISQLFRSQARPRVAKVHRLRNEVANSLQL